jgi:hypothetical protein
MPRIGTTVQKDKDASKVYAIQWSDFLAGRTITTSAWAIAGPDAALTYDTDSIVGTSCQARLSGGTAGQTYVVNNRITLSGSPTQTEERAFSVSVVDGIF